MSKTPNTISIGNKNFIEINISDIDLDDDRYQISLLKKDIPFIANSIKLTGLSNPPLVRPANDKYVIISGLSIIKAHIHNNTKTIIVQETGVDIEERYCLMKSIAAIVSSRVLSNAELILSVKRLNQYLKPREIKDHSKNIYNTQFNIGFIKKILTISAMPEPCLNLIHEGQLSIKSAERISGFSLDIQKTLLTLFSKIKASNSNQLEIIQNLFEISAREKTPIDLLIKDKHVLAILNENEINQGQMANKLRDYLAKKRFPTIVREHESLNKKITSLKLGNSIKILPPPNFESQIFNFGFTAKSVQECQKHIKTLNDSLNSPTLREIFKK